jgi:hypothetical protein
MTEAPPPDPQPKLAKNMSPQERAAALAILRRGPELPPLPIDKTAAEMTPEERARFLRECERRAG